MKYEKLIFIFLLSGACSVLRWVLHMAGKVVEIVKIILRVKSGSQKLGHATMFE